MKAKAIMERGELVPDELVCDMVAERLQEAGLLTAASFWTAFRGRCAQAEWLDEYLEKMRSWKQGDVAAQQACAAPVVIRLVVEYNDLLQRITGRRSCPTCGRIYNVYFQPPKVEGICDVDGTALVDAPGRRGRAFSPNA